MPTVRWEGVRAAATHDPMAVDALDGDVLVLDGVGAADDTALGWIRRAPCVVIGIAPEGTTPSGAVDVAVAAHEVHVVLDRLLEAVSVNQHAARILVDVLRSMPSLDLATGLAFESLGYSTLLAGPEFARWLAGRERPTARQFTSPPVRTERDGDRLRITLCRPDNRNAFSAEMRDALFDALAAALLDPALDDVELVAEGPVFSSGGDLAEFGTTPDVVRAHEIRTQRSVGALLARLGPKVTVRVQGACVGAGVELPAFASHVVAAPGTTFRLPEVGMGLIPGAGGTVSITRRIGRQATARLALLGDALDASAAHALGLVDAVRAAD